MPFKSEAQRRFLWAKHPEIAEKWAHGEHSTKGKGHKMPHKRKRVGMPRKDSNGYY